MRIPFDINLKTFLRWLFGLLFVFAAVSKIANPTRFYAEELLAYQLPLPGVLIQLAAIALPWFELLLGLSLLAHFWTETSMTLTFAIYIIFTIATGQAWLRGLDIACGCFDLSIIGFPAGSPTTLFLESARFGFFRNIVLTAGALYGMRATGGSPAPSPSSS